MSRAQAALLALVVLPACPVDFSLGLLADGGSEPKVATPGGPCVTFEDCASQDCASGICVDRSGWTCTPYASCAWDGGSCQGNLASCQRSSDCCSGDCGLGVCLEGNPAGILAGDGGAMAGCVTSGSCAKYEDCCSQNCLAGGCARAPTNELCKFDTPCLAYTDCCSFECRAGLCTDSTVNP